MCGSSGQSGGGHCHSWGVTSRPPAPAPASGQLWSIAVPVRLDSLGHFIISFRCAARNVFFFTDPRPYAQVRCRSDGHVCGYGATGGGAAGGGGFQGVGDSGGGATGRSCHSPCSSGAASGHGNDSGKLTPGAATHALQGRCGEIRCP